MFRKLRLRKLSKAPNLWTSSTPYLKEFAEKIGHIRSEEARISSQPQTPGLSSSCSFNNAIMLWINTERCLQFHM